MHFSITGPSHKSLNKECEDSYIIQKYKDLYIIVLADGAGSAKYAKEASSLVAKNTIKILSGKHLLSIINNITNEEFIKKKITAVIRSNRIALIKEANKCNSSIKEYSTTLIINILGLDFFISAQIGDGAVVAIFENKNLELITIPIHGDYANQTIFLTSQNIIDYIQIYIFQKIPKYFFCFTDGIEDLSLLYPFFKPYEPFFLSLIGFIDTEDDINKGNEILANTFAQDKITEKNDDDKTMVIGKFLDNYGTL